MSDELSATVEPIGLAILEEEEVGTGGFLHLRRLHLENCRRDGSRSRRWLCDFVERRKGVDAVVLGLWRRRGDGAVEVLLRDGLRPALRYGRPALRIPLADPRPYLFFTEVVAGIIEEGEVGEAAVRRRAVEEAWEEAGLRLPEAVVVLLGAGSFPSPGMTAEKFWLCAAEVTGLPLAPPPGDGSPMEEGARLRWRELSAAITDCEAGLIEDAKSELVFRRLAARLAADEPTPPSVRRD